MLVSSFLSRRDDRTAQLISDIADAYAIPKPMFGGGFIWKFHDGSSLLMTGREAGSNRFIYCSAVSFDADGNKMYCITFDFELADKPAL